MTISKSDIWALVLTLTPPTLILAAIGLYELGVFDRIWGR